MAVNWTPGPAFIPQAGLPAALQAPANIYASGNEVGIGNVDTAPASAGAATTAPTTWPPKPR